MFGPLPSQSEMEKDVDSLSGQDFDPNLLNSEWFKGQQPDWIQRYVKIEHQTPPHLWPRVIAAVMALLWV